MEEHRLDRVRIEVASGTVDISRRDLDALLHELCLAGDTERIRREFLRAGESTPVELDEALQSRLRAVLEAWDRDFVLLEGIGRLHAALKGTSSDAAPLE